MVISKNARDDQASHTSSTSFRDKILDTLNSIDFNFITNRLMDIKCVVTARSRSICPVCSLWKCEIHYVCGFSREHRSSGKRKSWISLMHICIGCFFFVFLSFFFPSFGGIELKWKSWRWSNFKCFVWLWLCVCVCMCHTRSDRTHK